MPKEAQAALALELMQHVEDVSTPDRPLTRQALIKERLARPLEAVSRDEFLDLLRHYKPGFQDGVSMADTPGNG